MESSNQKSVTRQLSVIGGNKTENFIPMSFSTQPILITHKLNKTKFSDKQTQQSASLLLTSLSNVARQLIWLIYFITQTIFLCSR